MATQASTTAPSATREFSTLLTRLKDPFEHTTWTGWLIFAAGIFAGVVAGKIAQAILRAVGDRFRKRGAQAQAVVIEAAATPLSLALITGGLSIALASLALSEELKVFVGRTILLLYTISLAWFLFNAVDVLELLLHKLAGRTESKLDDQIVPLLCRSVRLAIVVVFILFIAQNIFGADITAWLAGLGIVGLAVSLGAQDSIKNLFGSLAIFLDRNFSVGDRIVVSGSDGVVEEIGFRSTKLRTADGEVVTIPNAKVVDGSVTNFSRRQRIRRSMSIALAASTSSEQAEHALQIVKQVLAEPDIAEAFQKEFPPRVVLADLNPRSLSIAVQYWFHPVDDWKFQQHAEKVNLKIKRALEQAQISLLV